MIVAESVVVHSQEIAARLLRLGFMADFLSRPVLIGFGFQVALGQIAGMLGLQMEKLWNTAAPFAVELGPHAKADSYRIRNVRCNPDSERSDLARLRGAL